MVYGNYDPAYIQPNCDVCGTTLEKRHEYMPFKIEVASPTKGNRTSEHEGHICNDCNELDGYPFTTLCEVEYHYTGPGPASLLMVDVMGTHRTGGAYHSIHKYGPDDVPEFIRCLGAAILECRRAAGSTYDNERVDELASRCADTINEM